MWSKCLTIVLSLIFFNNLCQCQKSRKPFLTKLDFARAHQLSEDQLRSPTGQFREDKPIEVPYRNVPIATHFKWPNAKIPYILSALYSDNERAVIARAMDEYHKKTCIRFVPKAAKDKDYIELTPNDGKNSYCYSYVGRQGGHQYIKMYGECIRAAAMIHELGHVVGFAHEHQRPDRDDHIQVLVENIVESYRYAFDKESSQAWSTLSMPYDFKSTMHYPSYAYSKNGKVVMVPKDPNVDISKENLGLSDWDVKKIKHYYGCA